MVSIVVKGGRRWGCRWLNRQAEACPAVELGWGLGLAVAVNKLWVEIDAAIPFYGVV